MAQAENARPKSASFANTAGVWIALYTFTLTRPGGSEVSRRVMEFSYAMIRQMRLLVKCCCGRCLVQWIERMKRIK